MAHELQVLDELTVERLVERREELAQAAFEVVATVGLERTSLKLIASHLGLSKGAIFHHFKSRQDLLLAMLGLSCRALTD